MVSRDPEPKFTKFGKQVSIGQRPQWCQISHPPTASVRDIRCQKFVLPPKWIKVHQTCYVTMPVIVPYYPSLCQISSRLAKRCTRKALQFFKLCTILAPQENPLGRSSPISVFVYSKPFHSTRQISSRSDKPCARYLLPNFVHFVRQKKQKKTVNDSLRIPCGERRCH